MELRVLQYFLAVVQEGSISAAAEYLHITQPTLSRQLIELEKELDVKLFIRGRRKIILTDEGILLHKRAEEITDLVQKTQSEVTASNELIRGDIYIGSGETSAISLIAKVIKEIQEDHAGIRVHLFSGNAEDVTERLDKGLLDFGLLIHPTDVEKYQSLRLPTKDKWGVLMRKDSHLAEKENLKPENLWDLPLITSQQRLTSGSVAKWIKKDYEQLHLVATYNLVYNASIMVEEGLGYALCLDKLVNTTGSSMLCFKPLDPILESSLDIVWKKHQVFSKAAELLFNRMQNQFR